jgi:hypothetical protein
VDGILTRYRGFDMQFRSRRHRAGEQGKVNFIGLVLVVLLLVAGYFAYLFVPYHIDYMNMKEVVTSSSLAWYANDAKTASEKKLDEQLRAKEIDYITRKDNCDIDESGDMYVVTCSWEVDVYYVPSDYFKTLTYETTAECDKGGSVMLY